MIAFINLSSTVATLAPGQPPWIALKPLYQL
jgi:hypothetical protein